MPPRIKALLSWFTPPIVRRGWRLGLGWRWFRGRYESWAEAQAYASNYENPAILERVLQATLTVRAGGGRYERDSVVFHDDHLETEVMLAIFHAAETLGRPVRLVDFGGALGSLYWQHRTRFSGWPVSAWIVVEQPHFVAAGRTHLASDELKFATTLSEAVQQHGPVDVLLLSGVVHCLPEPEAWIRQWCESNPEWIILHNVPLHENDADYVMVQHVPPEIYSASYPVWFFNRQKFIARFTSTYEVAREYAGTAVWDRGWVDYPSSGLVLRRRPLTEETD